MITLDIYQVDSDNHKPTIGPREHELVKVGTLTVDPEEIAGIVEFYTAKGILKLVLKSGLMYMTKMDRDELLALLEPPQYPMSSSVAKYLDALARDLDGA